MIFSESIFQNHANILESAHGKPGHRFQNDRECFKRIVKRRIELILQIDSGTSGVRIAIPN